MAKELWSTRIKTNIMGNGKITRKMAKDFISFLMETYIKDTLKMIKKMELEFLLLNSLNFKKLKELGNRISLKAFVNILKEAPYLKETSSKM